VRCKKEGNGIEDRLGSWPTNKITHTQTHTVNAEKKNEGKKERNNNNNFAD
jgi:hypothetical protein